MRRRTGGVIRRNYVTNCLGRLRRNDPFLQNVYLSHQRIRDIDAQTLAECLPNCTHLKRMSVDSCHMSSTDRFEAILYSLQHNPSIQCLSIKSDKLGKNLVRALSELLKVNQTMQTVHITMCKLHDSHAIELSKGLAENSSLVELNLSYNGIGDVGIEAILESLESNTILKNLFLRGNKIGIGGATKIANFVSRNKTLRTLSVDVTPIGVEGNSLIAESMKQNTSLCLLQFDGTAKEKATVKFFEALNKRQGRKLLSVDDAHACLWARVLSKVGNDENENDFAPDMVFYLLREKPVLCSFLPPPVVRTSLLSSLLPAVRTTLRMFSRKRKRSDM